MEVLSPVSRHAWRIFSHRIFAPRAPIRRLLTLVDLSVEVSGEGGAFTVPVRAESIRRAAEFVASGFSWQ